MSKKPKLERMSQTHGKVDTFKPTTLDQIWGDTGLNKYGTMDVTAYEQSLNVMNKADLQAHATKVGIVPIDSRERMIKTLLHTFKLHVASYRQPSAKSTQPNSVSAEAAKILSEGR